MIVFIVAVVLGLQAAPAAAPPPESAWTWTLYPDSDPVVLANEVPDTTSLRATLECDAGSGVARLTLYGGAASGGMARLAAGDASAVSEAEPGRRDGFKLAVRTDHPVFAAFAAQGRLSVSLGEARRTVEVPRAFLPRLRRFAELCAG